MSVTYLSNGIELLDAVVNTNTSIPHQDFTIYSNVKFNTLNKSVFRQTLTSSDFNLNSRNGYLELSLTNTYNLSTTPIYTNQYYNIVLTRKNNIINLYVNGVKDKNVIINSTSLSGNNFIYSNGTFNDVRLYNEGKSEDWVKYQYALYASNNAGIESDLIFSTKNGLGDTATRNENYTIVGNDITISNNSCRSDKDDPNQYIDIPINTAIANNEPFTLAFWIKKTGTWGTNDGILGTGSSFHVRGDNNDIKWRSGGINGPTTTNFDPNNWNFVVVTKTAGNVPSGGVITIYLDGAVEVISNTHTSDPSSSIGNFRLLGVTGISNSAPCILSDVKLYKGDKGATWVKYTYNQTRKNYVD